MDMQDNAVPDSGEASISVVTPSGDHDFRSVSQAARALTQARHKSKHDQSAAAKATVDPSAEAPRNGATAGEAAEPSRASPAAADVPQESASGLDPEAGAAPRVEEPGVRGETEGADPAQTPSIEPPRSWTKEDKELWKGLPRETQARLAERERSRESDFLRRQNEAADKLKGMTAREQAAEQARQHYETALPVVLQTLELQQADEFADVKSTADVEKMAREDAPRYARWQAQQQQLSALQQQFAAAQVRSAQEKEQQWAAFAKRQDELFNEKVPDFADRSKAAKLQDAAIAVLKDVGFTEQELGNLWTGRANMTLRDHRLQLLILDGVKYREAHQKAKQAVAKPVPPVQRPGVSQPRGAAQDAAIQALSKRLETSGNLKDAAALIAARRKAAR
jgi:hypothetical protein